MNINFDEIFPDLRESGETPLQRGQFVILRMLKIFHYLCQKHNVKYFLIGGSSIGAVRHQGFIPWDDDIDIGITRANHDLFIKKCVPELPADIFFQDENTDQHYPDLDFVNSKLRDKYSSYDHKDGATYKYHDGLQLDIFVYDKGYLPSKLGTILENITLNFLAGNSKRKTAMLAWIAKVSPFELVYGNNWQHGLGAMKFRIGPTYIREDEINDLIKVKFEDMECYIPRKYDEVLKRQYGNYMQLPPVEKRHSDHNVVLDPFTPCNHTEVLNWAERKA